jgi:hypothetical protein
VFLYFLFHRDNKAVAKEVEISTAGADECEEDGESEEEDSQDSAAVIKPGELFYSYDHFLARMKEHESVSGTKFVLSDSRLLSWYLKPGRDSTPVAHANPELKYYRLTSDCRLGGKPNGLATRGLRKKL